MQFHQLQTYASEVECDALIYIIESASDETLPPSVRSLVEEAHGEGDFSFEAGKILPLRGCGLSSSRVVVVGAGDGSGVDVRKAAAVAARTYHSRVGHITLVSSRVADAVDGWVYGSFEPGELKTSDRKTTATESITVPGDPLEAEWGEAVAASVNFARHLVNLPPNLLGPEEFAGIVADELGGLGVRIEVMAGEAIADFGGLQSVAAGSDRPPLMVVYRLGEGDPRTALVGKGVTFDTGGYTIKTRDGLITMKSDMGGAAAVVGAVRALAATGFEGPVLAATPLVENMISGSATRPGDVVTTYSGKTVEITNTDAEGRMILADALTWVSGQGPSAIVDAATLTGAMGITLGEHHFGLFSNSDSLAAEVQDAAAAAGENVWRLPMGPEYLRQLHSDIADHKNWNGASGGSPAASAFLESFVRNGVDYAHLDIASTAWGGAKTWRAPGATGSAVRTLAELVRARA